MTAPQLQPPEDVQRIVAASRRTAFHSDSRIARALLWPLWACLDPHTGRPSAPKWMAWAIYIAFMTGHAIPAVVCTLLLATMFGYSMFKSVEDKASMALTSADSIALAVKHEHVEREVTTTANVHYTVDGSGASVPAASLPPVPDAKTPSGDD